MPVKRGVVAVVSRGLKWLVIRRSQYVPAPGAFCFPGGGIEADETEEQALRREFREELDGEIVPVARLWQSVTTWRVALSWWRADLAAGTVLTPNPREVASVHWLTPDRIRRLPGLLTSNHEFLDAWERGSFCWE